MNLRQTCISEVRAAVCEAKPSATTLAEVCFAQIEEQNTVINAYLAVSRERALKAAAAIDQLAAEGNPLPPLAGVPIGVKDVLVMKGSRRQRVPAYSKAISRLTTLLLSNVLKLQVEC